MRAGHVESRAYWKGGGARKGGARVPGKRSGRTRGVELSVVGAETESKRPGLFGKAELMLQGGGASDGEAGAEAVPGRAAQASLAPC